MRSQVFKILGVRKFRYVNNIDRPVDPEIMQIALKCVLMLIFLIYRVYLNS